MGTGLFSRRHIYIMLISIFLFSSFVSANDPGDQNETIITQVNVTNAAPTISSLTIPTPINLNPGTTTQINCTVDLYDYNGWETIKSVNATFWDNYSVTMGALDQNITHYTNDNCTEGANDGAYNVTYHCTFDVQYYAYNSSNWVCNVTVLDNSTENFTDTEFNTTIINPLYAINVTPVIDFGDATLGSTVLNRTANLTNFGNQAINISVEGYGASQGDGLAMDCSLQGNISISDLSFSSSDTAGKIPMTGGLQNMSNITLSKIDQATVFPGTWDQTYWELFVNPVNVPFGLCTGTIIFTAWNS